MTDQLSPIVCTRHLTVGYAGKSSPRFRSRSGRRSGLARHRPQRLGKDGALEDLGRPAAPVAGEVERRCGIGTGGAIYVHSVPYVFAGSVRRNLTLAHPSGDEVRAVADAFGLSTLLEREATTLSHGEQRRLALARAVADTRLCCWSTNQRAASTMRRCRPGEPARFVRSMQANPCWWWRHIVRWRSRPCRCEKSTCWRRRVRATG